MKLSTKANPVLFWHRCLKVINLYKIKHNWTKLFLFYFCSLNSNLASNRFMPILYTLARAEFRVASGQATSMPEKSLQLWVASPLKESFFVTPKRISTSWFKGSPNPKSYPALKFPWDSDKQKLNNLNPMKVDHCYRRLTPLFKPI